MLAALRAVFRFRPGFNKGHLLPERHTGSVLVAVTATMVRFRSYWNLSKYVRMRLRLGVR